MLEFIRFKHSALLKFVWYFYNMAALFECKCKYVSDSHLLFQSPEIHFVVSRNAVL